VAQPTKTLRLPLRWFAASITSLDTDDDGDDTNDIISSYTTLSQFLNDAEEKERYTKTGTEIVRDIRRPEQPSTPPEHLLSDDEARFTLAEEVAQQNEDDKDGIFPTLPEQIQEEIDNPGPRRSGRTRKARKFYSP